MQWARCAGTLAARSWALVAACECRPGFRRAPGRHRGEPAGRRRAGCAGRRPRTAHGSRSPAPRRAPRNRSRPARRRTPPPCAGRRSPAGSAGGPSRPATAAAAARRRRRPAARSRCPRAPSPRPAAPAGCRSAPRPAGAGPQVDDVAVGVDRRRQPAVAEDRRGRGTAAASPAAPAASADPRASRRRPGRHRRPRRGPAPGLHESAPRPNAISPSPRRSLAFRSARPRGGRCPGEVAQLVEHTTENRGVVGSIPTLAISLRVRNFWRLTVLEK